MTIVTPSSLDILKSTELLSPWADAEPLNQALNNTNYLYKYHRPAMSVVVWTVDPDLTRQFRAEHPVAVSADGLTYDFHHKVRIGSTAGTLTYTVEYWDGSSWNTLAGASAATTSTTANQVKEFSHSDTLPVGARKVRVTYTHKDGGAVDRDYTPDSLTIIPGDNTVTMGRKSSGVWPYDDTFLTSAGAPIGTEHCNRSVRNTKAIVADRSHCVLSFVQEDSGANVRHRLSTTTTAKPADSWVLVGKAMASLPYCQSGESISLKVLASVSAGATADIVRVTEKGGKSATFDATGSVESGTLELQLQEPGTLSARAELEVWAKTTLAGRDTDVHAVMGWWAPSVVSTEVPINSVAPPATMALLQYVCRYPEAWAIRPYCQPALCFDGNTDVTTRRFALSVGLAVSHARAWVTRVHEKPTLQGADQSPTDIETTSSGGVGTGSPSLIRTGVRGTGVEQYLDFDASTIASAFIAPSGDTEDDTPAAVADRLIELAEGKVPTVEVVEVGPALGFGLMVTRVTADLEAL